MIDSTTVKMIGKLIELNPSWSLVVLALIAATVYLLLNLSKNTGLTQQILDAVKDHNEMASTIKTIREDQIQSNAERKVQGEEIRQIKTRLESLEKDVEDLKK